MIDRTERIPARQLHLFKGKRQRGTKAPAIKEFSLHAIIGDVLKRWCNPSWRYTHMPMGEKRDAATAGRLARMGVTGGWPDFMFVHESGAMAWLELKRPGSGRPSEQQKQLAFFLMRGGHGYLLTDNFEDALAALRDWTIVPASVRTYGPRGDNSKAPRVAPISDLTVLDAG